MASPQCEDGYTKIANELMDALCRIRIPGEERQVLDTIFRKTYGWSKVTDTISLTQFVEYTGLNKPHIVSAIRGLLLKKVIIVTENGNDKSRTYRINKNYAEWVPLPKKVIVTENSNKSLPKTVPTKEKKKKEIYVTSSEPKKAPCPHRQIVTLYNEILGHLLPVVRPDMWNGDRAAFLQARWKQSEKHQHLEFWRGLFEYIRDSCPFLVGLRPGRDGPFYADLEWIVRPRNFVKIVEGKYDKSFRH